MLILSDKYKEKSFAKNRSWYSIKENQDLRNQKGYWFFVIDCQGLLNHKESQEN